MEVGRGQVSILCLEGFVLCFGRGFRPFWGTPKEYERRICIQCVTLDGARLRYVEPLGSMAVYC